MTKNQWHLVYEILNNKDIYLNMAESKKWELEDLYDQAQPLYRKYSTDVMNEALTLTGQQKAYKEKKIDPFIAGGAAQGAAGIGVGVATAVGSAARNQKIDNWRNYYDQKATEDTAARTVSERHFWDIIKALDAMLNSIPEIRKYRENALEEEYQKAKEMIKSNPSGAMEIFESLGNYKDSAAMISECKSKNTSSSILAVLVISAIVSLFIGLFGLAGGLTGYIMTFFASYLVCCVMFGIMAFKASR